MNAEETFKLTLQSIETLHKDLIESIFKSIEEARDRGEFRLIWPIANVENKTVDAITHLLSLRKFKVYREHQEVDGHLIDERYGPFGLLKRKKWAHSFSFYLRISWWKPDSSV